MQKAIRNKKQIKVMRTKGKKKKRPTACIDKRRDFAHCGICGSPDIAIHGVRYCRECDSETEWQLLGPDECSNWLARLNPHICKCKDKYYYQKSYSVEACLSCGAVNGPRCPNCKNIHWYHWNGNKHYCRRCGFRK